MLSIRRKQEEQLDTLAYRPGEMILAWATVGAGRVGFLMTDWNGDKGNDEINLILSRPDSHHESVSVWGRVTRGGGRSRCEAQLSTSTYGNLESKDGRENLILNSGVCS